MRIGVIGLGFMGTTHLKAWRNVKDAEVVAVCSENPKKLTGDLSAVQGNLGGSGETFDFSQMGRYTKIADLLADERVDAIDICLPTHMHAPVTIDGLWAGKHVLVEKPMALDGAQADAMIAEAAKAGRTLMTGQVLRFLPTYKALAEKLATGELGTVRSALFRRRCAAPFWNQWLGDVSRSGGGVFDLLIHDIDFALHLFGSPRSFLATGYENLPAGIDTLNASLVYGDGLSVAVTGGWHHPKSYPFSMEFTVVADGGTLEYSSLAGDKLNLYGADGEGREIPVATQDAWEAQLEYFTHCCRTGEAPALCAPEESAAAVRFALELLDGRRQVSGAA